MYKMIVYVLTMQKTKKQKLKKDEEKNPWKEWWNVRRKLHLLKKGIIVLLKMLFDEKFCGDWLHAEFFLVCRLNGRRKCERENSVLFLEAELIWSLRNQVWKCCWYSSTWYSYGKLCWYI